MERLLASRACSTALTRWSTLVPNFKPNTNRGRNEAEQDSGVAGRNCRRSGVDGVGFLGWDATGPALRGLAETRIIPERTALSVLHAHLDCADIRNVDSHRASLRVGSRHRRPWTEDSSQNRDDRRILRRRPRQLRASYLDADSAYAAPGMDARPVDRLDPSRASSGVRIQRLGRARNEITRWSAGRPRPAISKLDGPDARRST